MDNPNNRVGLGGSHAGKHTGTPRLFVLGVPTVNKTMNNARKSETKRTAQATKHKQQSNQNNVQHRNVQACCTLFRGLVRYLCQELRVQRRRTNPQGLGGFCSRHLFGGCFRIEIFCGLLDERWIPLANGLSQTGTRNQNEQGPRRTPMKT